MLSLGPAERERLSTGASSAGLRLDEHSLDLFCRLGGLLDEWTPKVNLIACRSGMELVERHLLDSLSLAPLVADRATIVDLGSGAGFPGLPLAIARPDASVILVEARRRRASYLREAKRVLELADVRILELRAEQGPPEDLTAVADIVVSRAVWSDESILPVAARWLNRGGRLLWMRGVKRLIGSSATMYKSAMIFEREHCYRVGEREGRVEVFRHVSSERFT